MTSKLFLVEGLPCTGKSTTANFVAQTLSALGRSVFNFDEGNLEHPADYTFSAFLSRGDLSTLSADDRLHLLEISTEKEAGLLVPLSKLEGGLFDRVFPYKIYDCLPWEKEKPVMLGLWHEFADRASLEDTTYVFNCCFLQNPLCKTYDALQPAV